MFLSADKEGKTVLKGKCSRCGKTRELSYWGRNWRICSKCNLELAKAQKRADAIREAKTMPNEMLKRKLIGVVPKFIMLAGLTLAYSALSGSWQVLGHLVYVTVAVLLIASIAMAAIFFKWQINRLRR